MAQQCVVQIRSRVYVLAQAAKHASTQCVCKSYPDVQGEKLVQTFCDLYMNKYSISIGAS